MQAQAHSQALIQNAHALETQAAYRPWHEHAVVRVSGDDRLSWLNGQLTNDVRQLQLAGSAHALAVNVRGKILAEVWVVQSDTQLWLLVPERSQDALLESLSRYIIMEDVELERAPELRVLGLEGPLAESADGPSVQAPPDVLQRSCAPLGLGGSIWIGDELALSEVTAQLAQRWPSVDAPAYELVRLRRGLPRYGVDFDEHHYPQEAGLKALVSFQKGCYLGQEVVCTLENRGKLSRRLCVLTGQSSDVPVAGTPLQTAEDAGGEAVGGVTSALWDPEQNLCRVLGYVRRNHAQPGATLRAGASTLTLISLVGEES